ncbi:MAG: aspartyl/glutamyl-tRNA amidotransferase subunit C [Treponema sp.]|jgi:aspartyl-tRNA(Asn)/glutamyl-tRNA(Gln) amidotransferase subunit C|nr:aspartyl/glutamyl-tRNA amidotransferase subunit C [Treponema sp.]
MILSMDIEDLKVTAQLAHLNLDEGELAASFPAFEQMLGFFAAMQAADGDTAAFPVPGSREIDAAGANARTVCIGYFRADVHTTASTGLNQPEIPNLIDNAGERDGRFILIPNVL